MLQIDDLVYVFVNSLTFVLNEMRLLYPGRNKGQGFYNENYIT